MGWIGFGSFGIGGGSGGVRPPPPVVDVPISTLLPPGGTNPPVVISPIGGVEIIRLQPPTTSPVGMLPPGYAPIEIQPQHLTETDLQIIGTLHWFKPANIDRDYPDGFSFQTTVTGSVP